MHQRVKPERALDGMGGRVYLKMVNQYNKVNKESLVVTTVIVSVECGSLF